MNKQQLAAKIWQSANKMRSKIEANEYKDYILGFIFYKFLSDKELKLVKAEGMTPDEIKALSEDNEEAVSFIKNRIGYFMAYDDLFSTWLEKGFDFGVADVRDALSAFNRHISTAHKKVFTGIFDTLQTGLSKLGDIITIDGVKLYASGDTSKTQQMDSFAALELDYALFPGDGLFNMGLEEAAECARIVGAKHNILIHLKPGESYRKKGEKWDAPNKLIIEPGEELEIK